MKAPYTLVLGLGIGFAVGWLLHAALVTPPEPTGPERGRARWERPVEPRPAVGDVEETLAHGPSPGPPVPTREEEVDVPALRREAAEALAAGEKSRFEHAVQRLTHAGTDEAHRAILESIRPESLPGPLIGMTYFRALHDADVPGIATVARRRFEMNLEAGRTSRVAAAGWVDLVARHGDDADIAWLVERDESGQIRSFSRAAIFSSPTAPARRAARRLLEAEGGERRRWPEYGRFDLEEVPPESLEDEVVAVRR
jgi:hypothetical protein